MASFNPDKAALLVIDMQNDFCPPTGSLAVPHGRDIVRTINSLLDLPFKIKVASQDYHSEGHISFSSQHAGTKPFQIIETTHPDLPGRTFDQMLWPDHCIQGTDGAEFVEGLEIGKIDVIVKKGQEKLVEAYSAFQDVWGLFSSELEKTLIDAGITDVFIVGLGIFDVLKQANTIAEDYCVKWSTLDARKRGFKAIIVEDCTKGVAEETTQEAMKECKAEGVEYMTSSEVKKLFGN